MPHTRHSEHPLGSAQVGGKKGDLWHPSDFTDPTPLNPSCRSLRRPDLGELSRPLAHPSCHTFVQGIVGIIDAVRDLLASQAVTARGDSLRSCAALPTPAAVVG